MGFFPGMIVRYGAGSTALARLSKPHAGGWHGIQYFGGGLFMQTHNLSRATSDEEQMYCAEEDKRNYRNRGSLSDFESLRYHNNVRQHEWDSDNQITLAYRGNEFGGETGEALEEAIGRLLDMLRLSKAAGKVQNIVKKLEREALGIAGSRATKQSLADELADVLICVDLIAMKEDIDLWQAVKSKFNATSQKVGLKTEIP